MCRWLVTPFILAFLQAGAHCDPLKFIALGDWGETLLPGQANVAEQMGVWGIEHAPEFVLTAGDNIYPKGILSVNDRQMDNKWKYMYNQTGIGHLPWYASVGNHDYGNDGSGNEWNQVAYAEVEPRWIMPNLYYDFVVPAGSEEFHFIVFDSEGWRNGINNHTLQEEWFENTLATSTAHWKIVIAHRPVFSAGNYGPTSNSLLNYLKPLFDQYDVDVYLCGHDHNLQLIQPRLGPSVFETDYVISGGGGALWYSYDEEAELQLETIYDMRVSFFEMTWGFVGFTVDETQMHMSYIDSDGIEVYQFTRQHRAYADTNQPVPT